MLFKGKNMQSYIRGIIAILIVLIITGLSVSYIGNISTSRLAYKVTDEFYVIESIINDFEQSEKTLAFIRNTKYSVDTHDRNSSVLNSITHIKESISQLQEVMTGDNLNLYFDLRGLSHMIRYYEKYVTEFFNYVNSSRYIDATNIHAQYSNLVSYIYSYCSDLLIESIRTNQIEHNQSHRTFALIWTVLMIFDFLVIIFVIYTLYKLLHSIVNPVNRLISASYEMQNEHFDIDDIDDQTDIIDLKKLIQSFNSMKNSTLQLVEKLKEHNHTLELLRKQESVIQESKRMADLAKISSLRSQMNPHFLFNTLNTIRRVAQIENATETADLILSLSDIFRHSLRNDFTEVPLEEEISVTQQYYKIQKKRFGERVNLKWEIGPECDIHLLLIPPFIVEPIVENAFKHGLEPKIGQGLVVVQINIYDDTLAIIIKDNGCGIQQDVLKSIENGDLPEENGSGIGLYNIMNRLQLLGEEYAISFKSEVGKGTEVIVQMPVKYKE